jgi:predicted nucleotidyltransferase
MIKRERITAFVDEVARQFHPNRVLLFGSYASGQPHADSDVDLLVIMPHKGPAAVQAADIRKRVRAGFPLDLIVRSPQAITQRLALDDYFITEILEKGEVLYEGQHAGMG